MKESAVSLECEVRDDLHIWSITYICPQLYHWHDIRAPNSTDVTHTLVLGHIKSVHVRNAVLSDDGTVDPAKLRAVSRLGGSTYARVGEGFDLSRPSWKKTQDAYETLVNKKTQGRGY